MRSGESATRSAAHTTHGALRTEVSRGHVSSLGLKSGIGLVVANMVGAGVFLSTGFMAQSLSPGQVLLAWVIGGVLAMCGARAYAEVARLVPEGGGEYRYLSRMMHPSLGYLAGWASLLVGFSAPTALDALAAGAFARAVFPALEPRIVGAALIVLLTFVHAQGLHTSARVQNVLVGLKVVLLVGFVAVGVGAGSLSWPTWIPPSPAEAPVSEILGSLFFIAFAFSGWNAAVYAADEFKEPEKTVPRAMLIGCLAVGFLYLVVNYIFVANLTPSQGTVVFKYDDFTSLKGQFEQVTLGQAVMATLLGPVAAKVMSAVMLLLFISAMSAMLLVGPRVYAAMAKDGFLPAFLGGKAGRPPTGAVVLQGAIALLLLFTHDVRSVLSNVGAILVLFAALTVLGLFAVRARGTKVSVVALVCAGVYVLSAVWMLFNGFKNSPTLLIWLAAVAVLGLGAFFVTNRQRARS
ncbi:MAG: amino acid permease [Archangium gephyra]|uniref:Amino acid permease n=1 Tax=Archangium gephyra TaxID=48 RepID=A0A2W5VFX7_9BACT|nr:MAG: amino acid permease [Archangium gephyra]